METFAEVYESSRNNSWTFVCNAVMWSGLAAVIAASLLPWKWIRLLAVVIAIFGFSYYTALYASFEIGEKWRIRREWAAAHSDRLTEDERGVLTIDGANLTLGPIIKGFNAMLIYSTAAGVLICVRWMKLVVQKSDDSRNKNLDSVSA